MDEFVLRWLPALAALAAMQLGSRSLVHFLQLESYQLAGYVRTVRREWKKAIMPGALLTLVAFTLVTLSRAFSLNWLAILQTVLVLGLGVLLYVMDKKQKAKKPLVYTPRVRRLFAAMGILESILVLSWICLPDRMLCRVLVSVIPLFMPLWVALSALVVWPIEKAISMLYLREARQLLRERPDLIRVGITGSYGKTSVKFILGTLLREKYPVLVPPSSFNTPMGLTRVIREKLSPSHRAFVAEMGARHPGDIKELCKLVKPEYGVITSVGPQHLDTFKTIDRIKSTKYDLIGALPENGVSFFPDDGGICREFYDKTRGKKRLCSLAFKPEADVWAQDISVSAQGCSFRLCTKEGSVDCVTPLLGQHNIQNILLSAMVALELGVSLKQIAQGVARLQPVEHRLQLISKPGGITVIDDAFNSNPVSSKLALEVLAQFPGRHIVVTPGMVELGAEEADFNREFGAKIAECADVAILVGRKHTQPIMDGALGAGFALNDCHRVSSLQEATELLAQIGQPGDIVLFENDLPDNY